MDCDATWKFINGSPIVSGVIVAIVSVLMTVLVLRIYSKRNKRAELEAQDEYDSDKRTLKANARNEVIRETHEARLRSDIEPTRCSECDKEYPAWSIGSKGKSVRLGKNQWQHSTVRACRKCRYPDDPEPMLKETSEEYYARLNSNEPD